MVNPSSSTPCFKVLIFLSSIIFPFPYFFVYLSKRFRNHILFRNFLAVPIRVMCALFCTTSVPQTYFRYCTLYPYCKNHNDFLTYIYLLWETKAPIFKTVSFYISIASPSGLFKILNTKSLKINLMIKKKKNEKNIMIMI